MCVEGPKKPTMDVSLDISMGNTQPVEEGFCVDFNGQPKHKKEVDSTHNANLKN